MAGMTEDNNKIKKALVTGASSGIGESICRMLLESGYEVYGIGRDFEKCAGAGYSENGRYHRCFCDLTDAKCLTGTIAKINKDHDIDLLVNNAGVGYYGLHEELRANEIHELVAVNLEAPMIITNLLLRDIKRNSGTIVFISSVTATEVNPHGCAYGASKAGLTSFAHSLFAEVRKHGVRVINISPDMTMTGLYRNADFCCDDAPGACLYPEDVARALSEALKARDGMLYTDLTIVPQYHRIKKSGRD